ncbi:hypothetical protein BpHYR1_035431 [Brachionus plicatilis]|uniref:Uncharacterized protein n=1 Tax=Brachionus plicatilis TaxID=10195 RepID=A0A3M7R1H5_BRAPC|nr:hypothetical protein BpHYR1_035431 [Brachionus plicatilis]
MTLGINARVPQHGITVEFVVSIIFWTCDIISKKNLERTNNNVESWHSRIKPDGRNNLTINKVVELFRLEKSYMEADLIQVLSGETISCQSRIQKKKDRCIKQLVTNYQKDRIDLFIDGMCEALKIN